MGIDLAMFLLCFLRGRKGRGAGWGPQTQYHSIEDCLPAHVTGVFHHLYHLTFSNQEGVPGSFNYIIQSYALFLEDN